MYSTTFAILAVALRAKLPSIMLQHAADQRLGDCLVAAIDNLKCQRATGINT